MMLNNHNLQVGAHIPFSSHDLLAFIAPVPPAPIPAVAEPLSRASNSIHPFRPRGQLPLDSATFHNVERVDVTTLQSRTGG